MRSFKLKHSYTRWKSLDVLVQTEKKRLYFDSFGEPPAIELLHYLKSQSELEEDLPAVKCNAITVQHDQSTECGSLCLYVLKQLSMGINFLETRYGNPSNAALNIL